MSGLFVGERCWVCGSQVAEIGGEQDIVFAWCDCDFPEDHHEMELL